MRRQKKVFSFLALGNLTWNLHMLLGTIKLRKEKKNYLKKNSLHWIEFHCTAFICTTLHFTSLHFSSICFSSIHNMSLQCSALHYTAPQQDRSNSPICWIPGSKTTVNLPEGIRPHRSQKASHKPDERTKYIYLGCNSVTM